MKKILYIILILFGFMLFLPNVKAADKPIEDGVYVIHSSINDNYVLDAYGAIANNGTNIQLYLYNGGLSQKWIVKYLDSGYYEITSTIDDRYSLDANGAIFNNGVNIQLWQKNNTNAQKWIIKETKNGYFRIVSYNDGYSLDANGAVATNCTNIQLWQNNESGAQDFRFEKVYGLKKTIENGIYTISSGMKDSMMIDIYGGYIKNLSNIQLYQKNNGDNQLFYVNYLNNGYYAIRPYLNISYSLDVFNGNKTNGTNVELYGYNGGYNQQWIINDAGNGYYNIISRCNYLAIDVHGAVTKNEANIEVYTYHNNNNQKFKFNEFDLSGTKTIDNGYYFINNIKSSKKVLDVNYGVMENSRNVEIYDLNYGTNQKWYVEYSNNGYYKILCNKDKNYSLQVDGNNINIGLYTGKDEQQWIIKKINGYYYIISKKGVYLDLYQANIANTTNIQAYSFSGSDAQKFNFIKTADGISEKVLDNGIYRISSALNNNMFVDVNGASKANGTNVQLWSRNSSVAQKWYIEYLNSGYYKITSLVDLNKSLDVDYVGISNGTNVSIYEYSNSINQQWIIKDAGDGCFYIISNCNGLYLDVANGGTSNGTNILMWQYNGGKNQKFKFIKSEKETRVVDVSYHQGTIDWNKVSNSGVYGVILRIGYWDTEDERFGEYINEVKRLGIPYGIYLFSYASTTNGANIEANFTNSIISKYNLNPTLGIYYDLEDWYISADNTSNNLSKSDYDNIARTYINSVSSYVGSKYKVKIYANLNFINNRFGDYARSQTDWVARYGASSSGYDGPHSLWQYTSEATLDGIRGYVDMSYLY